MKSLLSLLAECRTQDRHSLRRKIRELGKNSDEEKLAILKAKIEASREKVSQKRSGFPKINYPEDLPVVQAKDDIKKAIQENQVVVIAGETGSGKTTQLPKILLEMGFGAAGLIGHTQPRRLAARSVATRIASELGELGNSIVGHKVRFQDKTGDQTSVKLMTDGILLAELQNDRFLNDYEVIIIDEAHERSLNIDFLLGVLKQITEKRTDLKIIVTSATIETQRFAEHFSKAPILEISGRTYPVEVRYSPLERTSYADDIPKTYEIDFEEGVVDAIEELWHEAVGDILIFLSGEREIRDLAEYLSKHLRYRNINPEIIPLFARLSAQEQNRIFQPHQGVRIVLATNVAETSLTVPGIKYVIDPGMARISRYSYRSKVQRLPVEPISQASANQRAGRCGRLEAGICVRLYSEDDFNQRPEFTDPEILRTNLAAVILQMASLKLGDIKAFPFLQRPDDRFINDGLRLLEELQAVVPSAKRKGKFVRLTPMGKQLGRLPIDPKLGRMILCAAEKHCMREVLIIVAALSIQDPRERPLDAQQKSDQLHARFHDETSDFLGYLKLWNYLQTLQKEVSKGQFRKRCKQEFIHYLRVREWQDLYSQLRMSVRELGLPLSEEEGVPDHIHQALLSGLLSQIGTKSEQHEYLGARQTKFFVFPGSALFKSQPKWIMAGELVETSRLYARSVAKINPQWIEPLALHLVKRTYNEPVYSKKQGAVVANEQVTLYGLLVVPQRKVQFARIDPILSREIFIKEALVNGRIQKAPEFVKHNLELISEIQDLEAKSRRRDLLVDEIALFHAYEQYIPEHIYDDRSLLNWWKKLSKADRESLFFTQAQLLKQSTEHVQEEQYPDFWQQGQLKIPLRYVFEPSADDDGVNVTIPLAALNQVQEQGFDWQVPAFRKELVAAWIKSLPKKWRRNFVPAPEFAQAILSSVESTKEPLLSVMTRELKRITGIEVPADEWNAELIPKHLKIHFNVIDENEKLMLRADSLDEVKRKLKGEVKETINNAAGQDLEREGMTEWTFGALPKPVEKSEGIFTVKAFPALHQEGKTVAIRVFESEHEAEKSHREGVIHLLYLGCSSPVKYLQQSLPDKAKLAMYFNPWGKIEALIDDCIKAAISKLLGSQNIKDQEAFARTLEHVRGNLNEETLQIAQLAQECLLVGHEVSKRIKGKIPLAQARSYADIKEHLDNLIFPKFVSSYGYAKLPDVLRYLQALRKRVERLDADPNRDRLRVLQVEKVTEEWKKRVAKKKQDNENTETLDPFRWHIEEYRVSLFAQELGTAFPVSEQRLMNALKELN
ncbi:ATP-dependent RNA helicase HrpA [Lysobacter sp. N42]|uniref:ATP-dependent RNA helicase HrpA n=2 Tax=Gammaproteobacteria TaxID=1236 RepID=UPI000DD06BB5|nr:ATP-dependent RNA helicase HrpA [Lysobacter sp. N42]RTE87800.1 ATP-dependent RNA helicase HrpA [Aliidiomarina sp. B3213]TCZ92909.1 ATP-dependent RNA helicase HrpA [Lysobacter sp. N42]